MFKLILAIVVAELCEHAIEVAFGWIRTQFKKKFQGEVQNVVQQKALGH